jgi:hypothetical protein
MKRLLILLAVFGCSEIYSQFPGISAEKELNLQAATKQIGQFIRRFNSEETPDGERLNSNDPNYRSQQRRTAYINMLFDQQAELNSGHKTNFIQFVTNSEEPFLLSLHGKGLVAEVPCLFKRNSKSETIRLYLRLQKENVGSKWVIFKAIGEHYNKILGNDTSQNDVFLHPLSHEIDFMNLERAFSNPQKIRPYLYNDFTYSHLNLMAYELKSGTIHFETVTGLKIHWTQIPGWYFKLEQIHRDNRNTGWLIRELKPVTLETAHFPWTQ